MTGRTQETVRGRLTKRTFSREDNSESLGLAYISCLHDLRVVLYHNSQLRHGPTVQLLVENFPLISCIFCHD